jgi:hypothetical protein
LPPSDFAFGRADNKDYEGAAKLTSSWVTHQVSKIKNAPKDFMRINKYVVR